MMVNPCAYTAVIVTAITTVTFISVTWRVQRFAALTWETPPANGTSFDFVVVGSGSSGSVVAARLAEAGFSVLLLEAGGPPHGLMGLGAFSGYFQGSFYDWAFTTEPSRKAQLAMKNRRGKMPRGKVLGGSSMLNFMVYLRGNAKDYDEWEEMGNRNWGYENLLQYFKKSEGFEGKHDNDERYHGREGPMGVVEQSFSYDGASVIADALAEQGYEEGDVNGERQDGGFARKVQVTQKRGWREGTFGEFVKPLLGKKNVTVLTFATASKLILEDGKCIGIELERFQQKFRYLSSKETILSAGAFGSPQLLMLSGIGPKEHLEELAIPVVKDLPVGKNLHDHSLVLMSLATKRSGLSSSPLAILNPLNYISYFFGGLGPLATMDTGPIALLKTTLVTEDDPRPDILLLTITSDLNTDFGLGAREGWNVNKTKYEEFFGRFMAYYGMFTLPTLLRPKSRGQITLRSKSIHDAPKIDPGYLTHPDDLRVLVEGAKLVHSLIKTEAMKRQDVVLLGPDSQSCPHPEPFSDEYWSCYVRHWLGTVYHSAGTCKMGPSDDPEAVVDSTLRVRGLSGLRVADASVMPKIVGANTHATCVVIGEKAADMIAEDWRQIPDHLHNNDKNLPRKDEL